MQSWPPPIRDRAELMFFSPKHSVAASALRLPGLSFGLSDREMSGNRLCARQLWPADHRTGKRKCAFH